MTKIYQYHVKIDETGNIEFKTETHKSMFKKWMSQWKGQEVGIEIVEKTNSRSGNQNRYYWFYLGLIEEETGQNKDELHAYFKGKFLTQKITELYGDKVRITKSTTELTRGQFCEYLIDISTLTGVELPDTEKYFGVSYHKK